MRRLIHTLALLMMSSQCFANPPGDINLVILGDPGFEQPEMHSTRKGHWTTDTPIGKTLMNAQEGQIIVLPMDDGSVAPYVFAGQHDVGDGSAYVVAPIKAPKPSPVANTAPGASQGNSVEGTAPKISDGSGAGVDFGKSAGAASVAAGMSILGTGLTKILVPGTADAKAKLDAAIADADKARNLLLQRIGTNADGFAKAVFAAQQTLAANTFDVPGTVSIPRADPSQVAQPQADIPSNVPTCLAGSIIRTDTLSLGEAVELVGTPFALYYFSDRTPGRTDDRELKIPITGKSVDGISRIALDLKVGGDQIHKTFEPETDLNYDYQWNGLDARGKLGTTEELSGTLTYTYADGSAKSRPVHSVLGHWQSVYMGLGGWTISVVHHYDPIQHRLYFGNGMTRNVTALNYGGGYLVTNASGSEVYIFDARGNHQKTLNGLLGNLMYSFEYGQSGALAAIVDAFNNRTSIKFDHQNIEIHAPFDEVTTLSLSRGWVAQITNPAGESYNMTSNPFGLLLSFRKPNGHISTMTYDAKGLLKEDMGGGGDLTDLARVGETVTATTALGHRTTFEMKTSDKGSAETVTDPSGLKSIRVDAPESTSWTQSPAGLITQATHIQSSRFGWLAPVVSESVSRVKGAPLLLSSTKTETVTLTNSGDPLSLQSISQKITQGGRVSTVDYSAATKTVVMKSPEGRSQTKTFDQKGQLIRMQAGDLTAVEFVHDARGRITTMTRGNRRMSYQYGQSFNPSHIQDSLGHANSFEYDGAGRVLKQTNAAGQTVHMTYDPSGNLLQIIPPGKLAHEFKRNDLETLGSNQAPGAGAVLFKYNLEKQLTSMIRPDGGIITYDRDSRTGRLNAIRARDASVAFKYSAAGLIDQLQSHDNVTTDVQYEGPLVQSLRNSGAVQGQMEFKYNSSFQLISTNIDQGAPIRLDYDRDGLVSKVGSEVILRSANTGLITGLHLSTLSETRSLNAFGEVEKDIFTVGGRSVFALELKRDTSGRIIEKTESSNGGISHRYTYGYNKAHGLSEVTRDGAVVNQYDYEPNGSRMTKRSAQESVNSATNEQDQLLSSGQTQFAYNANGELKTKVTPEGQTQYAFDAFGNMKAVALPNGTKVQYLIDGQGRRVGRKVGGQMQQMFLYQSQLQIVAELDGRGRLVKQFVYGSRSNVPDYILSEGRIDAIIADQLGSPRVIVDANTGEVREELDYDAFGKVVRDTNPGYQPFGFAGGLRDLDTGLVHFGAREYDPDEGRWLSKDPLLPGMGGDINPYRYALNNPVNNVDPNGLWAVQVGGSIAGLFPTIGGAAESGIAISYSGQQGLQIAGYQSGQVRAGVGIYGGGSLNVTVTPAATQVSDLNGVAVGGGIDTPFAGGSAQFSEINGQPAWSVTGGVGPGVIGDAYGAVTYTHVGSPVTFGGSSCQAP